MPMEIKTVKFEDRDYPILLREIQKPPLLLYYIGDLSLASKLCVSVVGGRKGTEYGKWVATKLGILLAQSKLVTVSGMAKGIDSYAHQGALKGGGKTIAVLGNGPDICFPAENACLMAEIKKEGLILSEYPPGTRGTKYSFPLRNRIISGLSRATVIVEAGLSSGSLITAERAAEQGREVYAVPGNINSIYSIGTNKLIQDGAKILCAGENILEDLNIKREVIDEELKDLSLGEKRVLLGLAGRTESTVDELAQMLEMTLSDTNVCISLLEIKGMVRSSMGKIYLAK